MGACHNHATPLLGFQGAFPNPSFKTLVRRDEGMTLLTALRDPLVHFHIPYLSHELVLTPTLALGVEATRMTESARRCLSLPVHGLRS